MGQFKDVSRTYIEYIENIESLKSIITNPHNHSYNNYLHKLCDTIDLVDIWKLQNPESVRYTRRKKTKYGLAQSRIDFFLISSNLEYTAKFSDILPGLKSDHSLLQICLLLEDQPKRGKGLWKMNTNLLGNEDFINLIKATIREAKLDVSNLKVQEMAWDYINVEFGQNQFPFQ